MFIPYGLGKRMCMGVSLAKAELLIFTVIILRQLKISVPKNHPGPDKEDADTRFARTPNPFYVHIERR